MKKKVDVTYLDQRFQEKGYTFLKKPIPAGDEMAAVEMGKAGGHCDQYLGTVECRHAERGKR